MKTDGMGACRTNSVRTILLVEDHAPFRYVLRRLLSAAGYRVLEAPNGVEAIEVARSYPDKIDLLCTEIVMPELDGVSLSRTLKRERADMQTLLMTGKDFADCQVLRKPFSDDDFIKSIRAILECESADAAINGLPDARPQRADSQRAAGSSRQGARGTVLVLDDEVSDRELMRTALQDEGYIAIDASHGHAAMITFREHQGAIDMLVADVALPGGNGCDVAKAMLRMKPDLKVLFVSGHAGAEICRFYGFPVEDMRFLRKPFERAEFVRRVHEVFELTDALPAVLLSTAGRPR